MSCKECTSTDTFIIPDHKYGTTWKGFKFQVFEDDETTVVDVTGHTFIFMMRVSENAAPTYEASTTNNKIQIVNNDVIIMPIQKVLFNPNRYLYDIKWIKLDGTESICIEGTWKICKTINQ